MSEPTEAIEAGDWIAVHHENRVMLLEVRYRQHCESWPGGYRLVTDCGMWHEKTVLEVRRKS